MIDNRAYTEITRDELANTETALAKLDSAYQSNRMTKAMYLSRRERLVKNLERVLSTPTPLATNPTAFYARDEINLSPRPTGYQESLDAAQQLDGPMRKASESQIRQAALQDAYSEVETASIMDALHDNAPPSNFQAALSSVNNVQISQLLGTKREPSSAQLAGVWADIANSPGVVNALSNLSKTVQSRVESVIGQGLPVSAAENYILSNARNAGAALTREGYDRQRAAEVVKSVINGELSIIAAQNIVSGDLRDATRAVVTNNTNYATHPTPSPNAAKVNTEKMTVQEIVEVRNAALDTLADPLAFEDELEWAASFVEEANNSLNQRMNQKEAIVGNSAYQVKVSTEPPTTQINHGDGLPTPIVQQTMPTIQRPPPPMTVQEAVQAIPAFDKELEAKRFAEEAAKKAAEDAALKAAAAAAMREAQEKALQAAANKAKREANARAKKKANEARRARDVQEKKRLEEEVRQAKLLAAHKAAEEAAAKKAAAKAAEEKRFANQAAKNAAAQLTTRRGENQWRRDLQKSRKSTGQKTANAIPNRNKTVAVSPPPTVNASIMRVIQKATKPTPKPTVNASIMREIQMVTKPTPMPPPTVNASIMRVIQKVTKPGPAKAQVTKPAIIQEFNIPQRATTKPVKPTPVNRRSPSQKVANALAKLPSQQNVDRVVATLPRSKANAQRRKTRNMLGTTSTSTSHDPRRFHRDDELGLGASTSTTSSSRTSGAYRFEDPRIMHRWE